MLLIRGPGQGWRKNQQGLLVAIAMTICVPVCVGDEAGGYAAAHDEAVRLGRAGQYDASLAILGRLTSEHPGAYPLQRDYAIITAWSGDCDLAVQRYRAATPPPGGHEVYLILPISDCLLDTGRPREAIALAQEGLAQHPDDPQLRQALLKARISLKLDHNVDERATELSMGLSFDESDQDKPEWIGEVYAQTGLTDQLQLFGRYYFTTAIDDDLEAGNQRRLGIGAAWRFNPKWKISEEVSTDFRDRNLGGTTTTLTYDPYDNLELKGWYASYSLDTPLRARAAGIYASQAQLSVDYHTYDYVWSGYAETNYFDFDDGNVRKNIYMIGRYAYERHAQREYRVFAEWYQSSNTESDTPYFNPRHDYNLNLGHITDFIHRSVYWRHVDRLRAYIGVYQQEDYGSDPVWGISFEQDYDFDRRRNLVWRIGYQRAVYDGDGENEISAGVYYRQRF